MYSLQGKNELCYQYERNLGVLSALVYRLQSSINISVVEGIWYNELWQGSDIVRIHKLCSTCWIGVISLTRSTQRQFHVISRVIDGCTCCMPQRIRTCKPPNQSKFSFTTVSQIFCSFYSMDKSIYEWNY